MMIMKKDVLVKGRREKCARNDSKKKKKGQDMIMGRKI